MTQSLSRQLAQWVHGLRFEDLPPAVVNRACAATLQGLTSALVGSQFPDAQQALAWELVSRVVPEDQVMSAAREFAARITQNSSHGVRLTKRLLREAMRSSFDTVLELSAVFQAVCHKQPDHTEAVNAFLEKRSPKFD